MDDIFLVLIFLVLGLLAGLAAGMLGIGGGIILVPSLFYTLPFAGIDSKILSYTVIGTSLFCGAFASFSSAVNHYKTNNVDIKRVLLFASGSMLAAFVMPMFVIQINPLILKFIFSLVLILILIKMLLEWNQKLSSLFEISDIFLPFFGILAGVLAAMTGIGGGVLFVPILTYFYAVNLKKSIGTSSAGIFLTMLSSAISYSMMQTGNSTGFQLGFINLFAGIPIAIGALAGAVLGVRIVLKAPVLIVKRIFSVFLIIIILRMMIY